jgi:hypothetical protein
MADGNVINGYRVGWYWLRLNRSSPDKLQEAGDWVCVRWKGQAFSTLGVMWCRPEDLGDETAWGTLGPYLGTAPVAVGNDDRDPG